MAQTFRDFMFECEAFPYSQAYFDLLKESSEITLMGTYLDAASFMEDNEWLIDSGDVEFTEGYFIEAAKEKNALTTETFGQKVKGFFKKIWQGFLNLIKKIKTFFVKLINSRDNIGRRGTEVLNSLRKVNLSKKEMMELVENILEPAARKIAPTIVFHGCAMSNGGASAKQLASVNQPFRSELKLNYAQNTKLNNKADLNQDYRRVLENYLAAAFSTTSIKLLYVRKPSMTLDADTVVKGVEQLFKAKHADQVESIWQDMYDKGHGTPYIEIVGNTDKIQKLINALENAERLFEERQHEFETRMIEGIKDSGAKKADQGKMTQAFTQALAKFSDAISVTMSVYTAYMDYRREVIINMSNWITDHKKRFDK